MHSPPISICRSFLFSIVFLGYVATVFAQQTVQVCGEGVILKGDQVSAKRLALLDARTRAIEKVVGVTLDSSTVLQNELIVESLLSLKSNGHISDEVMISETSQDEIYKVCIEARVSPGKAAKELKDLVGQTRVIILSNEIRNGFLAPKSVITQVLKQHLVEKGFTVVDEFQWLMRWMSANSGNRPDDSTHFSEFSQALFAGFVVVIQAETIVANTKDTVQPYNMGSMTKAKAMTAFGNIRIFHGDTSLLIAEKNFDRIAGFDLTSLKGAGEKALLKTGKKVSPWLEGELSAYLRKGIHKVDLLIHNVPDRNRMEQIVSLLNLHRWASHVQLESFVQNGSSRITLQYADHTVYLANFLEKQTLPGNFRMPRHVKKGPNLLVYNFQN